MKFLKYLFLFLIVVASAAILYFFINDKPRPEGVKEREAGLIALNMLEALNYQEWMKTAFIGWTSDDGIQYVWDKLNNVVFVKSGDMEIIFNTSNLAGSVEKSGQIVSGMKGDRALKEALEKWREDSFWVSGPFQLIGKKVVLKTVLDENNSKQLLSVLNSTNEYSGDAILWKQNEDDLPISCKMWVSTMPMGGTEASWEGWAELSSGAKISTIHKIGLQTIEIFNLKDGKNAADFGLDPYLFQQFY